MLGRAKASRATWLISWPTPRDPVLSGRTTGWPPSNPVAIPCSRYRLLLEGVLHLLARIFQAGLRLVNLALILGALVIGELADGFFGLAAPVIDLVTDFVSGTHLLVLLPAPCGASLRYGVPRRP